MPVLVTCAADLQLKMGAATRNLSLALQQCDVKQNMAIRSKLVSQNSESPLHVSAAEHPAFANLDGHDAFDISDSSSSTTTRSSLQGTYHSCKWL
jgi:hypothetical protein